MDEGYVEDKPALFVPMGLGRLLQALAVGAVVGLTVWALTLFLERYVFEAILCHGAAACGSSGQYAEAAATVIGAGVGLYFLAKAQVYRPLLIVLAASASLWGILGLVELLPWYGVGLSVVGLYAFAYGLYSWLARVRIFWLVMVVFLVLIVAVRLIFSA
jgi:hypothetical protein